VRIIVTIVVWLVCLGVVGPIAGITLEDDLGYAVELPGPAQRLVSLAPSNTELLFAIGAGAGLVGVTEHCNYPEAAKAIEKIGKYKTLSIEKIAATKPDLVVAIRGNDLETLESLRQLGIPVFALEIKSVEEIFGALERLGRLTGHQPQAVALVDSLKKRVNAVQQAVAKISAKPPVLWGFLSAPVYTAGKDTYIEDLITLAGGENLGSRAQGAWPQISLETMISWAPEVILTTDGKARDRLSEELKRLLQTDGWKTLPAVKSGRIHYLEDDLFLRPGPRSIEVLERIARLLNPAVTSSP